MTSSMMLLLLAAIFSSAHAGYSFSPAPWWKDRSLRWTDVDPDWNWEKRQTGVKSDWSAGLAQWSHYNATSLSESSAPWTSGCMCKFLRQHNASAFQLQSVYEAQAVGLWLNGFLEERSNDGLLQHGHVFTKTPYRISSLPTKLPQEMIEAGAGASRVTIVQPDSATFSGPRWLPTVRQAGTLLKNAKDYSLFNFCEMWLAETIDGQPEARKIGLFCQYDGITGELVQVFRMREVAVPGTMAPLDPDEPLRLDAIRHKMRKYSPWASTEHLETEAAKALISGQPMPKVIHAGTWSSFQKRAVQSKGPNGPEVACSTSTLLDTASTPYYSAADENPDLFFDCRFDDGAYARIPRTFHPDQIKDRTPICMELGCVTQSRNFHRLIASGTREAGGLHTTVYERWSNNVEE